MGIFNQFLRNSYKETEFLESFNNIAVPLALCLGTTSRGLVMARSEERSSRAPPDTDLSYPVGMPSRLAK